jgi:Rod binding domain-containing protein
MVDTKLIFPEHVTSLSPLQNLDKSKIESTDEEKKKQIAKDFESLLINKLLDEMKNSIGEWGFERDGASSQIQGIFWMYLSQDISDNGGIGLWKEIYKTMGDFNSEDSTGKSLDGQL